LALPDSFAELNQRYGIAGTAAVVEGNGGLAKVVISTPHCSGEMYLHGGHMTSWIPSGEREVLYLSPNSLFQDGKAIRGGVPVCFPWFGDKVDDPIAPAHGFVRTKSWQLEGIESSEDEVVVNIATESDEATRNQWPHDFRLVCRATVGGQLKVELVVTNTGPTAFSFEEALHAYFLVGGAGAVAIGGLDATRYIDKVDHRREKMQSGELRIAGETDRVYLDTQHEIEVRDSTWQRLIVLHKQDSRTTVTWNPWVEKSSGMGDLGAGEWKNFVCVETSNVVPYAVQLDPGESHTMTVVIEVVQL
jgi:glucose-6-phosphate 1-epimerase